MQIARRQQNIKGEKGKNENTEYQHTLTHTLMLSYWGQVMNYYHMCVVTKGCTASLKAKQLTQESQLAA